jgi:hypothetical protein
MATKLICKACGHEINYFPEDPIHCETWECSNNSLVCGKEWASLEEVEADN